MFARAPDAARPGETPYRADARCAESPGAHRYAVRCAARRRCEGASRRLPKYRAQSSPGAFLAHKSSGVKRYRERPAGVQAIAELGQRGTLSDLSQLREQIVRKRHARGRGPGLEAAVKDVRDISNL